MAKGLINNGMDSIKYKGKLGSAGRAPSLRIILWHLPKQPRKKHGKTSVRDFGGVRCLRVTVWWKA
jgi:hypothetical protein